MCRCACKNWMAVMFKRFTMNNKQYKLYLLVSMLLVGLSANAASFDCNKARSFREKTICSDPELSSLDEQLNYSYKDAVERSDARKTLVLWQRAWLKSSEINYCKDAKCLTKEISSRITILDSVAAKNNPAAQWNGDYSRFFQGAKDETASILLIGLNGNQVYISGSAVWIGPNAANGQVNTGEIVGVGKLKNGKAVFDFDGCNAIIVKRQSDLFVEEESGCGGVGVSFMGNYKRISK